MELKMNQNLFHLRSWLTPFFLTLLFCSVTEAGTKILSINPSTKDSNFQYYLLSPENASEMAILKDSVDSRVAMLDVNHSQKIFRTTKKLLLSRVEKSISEALESALSTPLKLLKYIRKTYSDVMKINKIPILVLDTAQVPFLVFLNPFTGDIEFDESNQQNKALKQAIEVDLGQAFEIEKTVLDETEPTRDTIIEEENHRVFENKKIEFASDLTKENRHQITWLNSDMLAITNPDVPKFQLIHSRLGKIWSQNLEENVHIDFILPLDVSSNTFIASYSIAKPGIQPTEVGFVAYSFKDGKLMQLFKNPLKFFGSNERARFNELAIKIEEESKKMYLLAKNYYQIYKIPISQEYKLLRNSVQILDFPKRYRNSITAYFLDDGKYLAVKDGYQLDLFSLPFLWAKKSGNLTTDIKLNEFASLSFTPGELLELQFNSSTRGFIAGQKHGAYVWDIGRWNPARVYGRQEPEPINLQPIFPSSDGSRFFENNSNFIGIEGSKVYKSVYMQDDPVPEGDPDNGYRHIVFEIDAAHLDLGEVKIYASEKKIDSIKPYKGKLAAKVKDENYILLFDEISPALNF